MIAAGLACVCALTILESRDRGGRDMRYFLMITAFVLCFALPAPRPQAADLSRYSLSIGAVERSYYLHIPASLSPSPPLLISLHGGGRSEGDDYAERNGYTAIADREGFIVAFPNGIDAQWNDGRGVTFRGAPSNATIDDVGFIGNLIDHLIRQHGIDRNRVFIEGSSNGGMMSQRLACELAPKIAGVATVIASMPTNVFPDCKPGSKLAMLIMNGTGDPWVPYGGGEVVPLGRPSGKIISTAQSIEFWREHNGCSTSINRQPLPNQDPRDGSSVVLHEYTGCARGAPVMLYEVINGGHSRPGMLGRVPERLLGPKNNDIDASEVIWAFFKTSFSN